VPPHVPGTSPKKSLWAHPLPSLPHGYLNPGLYDDVKSGHMPFLTASTYVSAPRR